MNYKIHVANEAESKEAQELFFDLGYMVVNNMDCEKGYIVASKNAESPINFDYWCDVKNTITLQELRDMVNQDQDEPFLTPETTLNDQYAEIEQVRKQTIEATLAERQAQYGSFEDVARTTGKIMEALSEVRTNGLNDLPYPHRMALYMIASKMARIVNGDFNHKDGWHDIGGYSKLVEDLL